MSYRTFKKHSLWLSQLAAAVSLFIIAFVRGKYIFWHGNAAGGLLLLAMFTSALTLGFGLAALPRWQGFVALTIFCFVAYCLMFVPLYAIP